MIQHQAGRVWSEFIDWILKDISEIKGRWLQRLNVFSKVIYIVIQGFFQNDLLLRASSLSYTVVLSLVPTLALGIAILKGIGIDAQMKKMAYDFITQLEVTESMELDQVNEAIQQGKAIPQTLSSHLKRVADMVFSYVEKTNFAALGAFGIAGLMFTVLSVMSSIENALNHIWQTGGERPIGRRLINYMALFIIVPVALNLAIAILSSIQGSPLWEKAFAYIPLDIKDPVTMTLLNFLLVVATFIFVYVFMPNTKVNIMPAIIGALVAGTGWFLTQYLYIKLQVGVARYNAIYGSLASLPLFLMWIYVGWVVFLVGAEVAYAAQSWKYRIRFGGKISPFSKLSMAFDILEEVYRNFENRQKTTPLATAERLKLNAGVVKELMDIFSEGGILMRLEAEGGGYVPSAPANRITVDEVSEIILGKTVTWTKGGKMAEEVQKAIKEKFSGKKLSEI